MRTLVALIALSLCTSAWGGSFWDTEWKNLWQFPDHYGVDWHDPNNWTNGVPGPDDSVNIPEFINTDPVIGYGQAFAESISISGETLTLTDGSLTTQDTYIHMASRLTQTGGTFTTAFLSVDDLAAFQSFRGETIITSILRLRWGSVVQMAPSYLGTSRYIQMRGADLVFAYELAQMDMIGVNLVFNGGMSDISNVECAFRNVGATQAGFDSSMTLDSLRIDDGIVSLVDNYDNAIGFVEGVPEPPNTPEAFYVRELEFASAGTIHTNGLDLYYLNGGDPKQFFWGDSNLDGEVSLSDLVTLASNYNQAGIWYDGDFNGDGIVSLADLTSLATNFGAETVVIEGAPIPEPATLSLLALGGMALARKRRR